MAEPQDLEVIKDRTNVPLPQLFDRTKGAFEPLTGSQNGMNVVITQIAVPSGQALPFVTSQPVVKDAFNGGTGASTHEFAEPMSVFAIINDSNYSADGLTDLTFKIGTVTLTVKGGESFEESFAAFTSVLITAQGPYRAYGKR